MAFDRMTDDMNIISKLPDEPNDEGGMTASALKATFDKAGTLAKTAINKLIAALGASTAAGNIGFARSTGVPADTVQGAIENVQSQIAGVALGSIPDGSITAQQLADGAVTGTKIADAAVTKSKLSDHVLATIPTLLDFSGAVTITPDDGTPAITLEKKRFFLIKPIGLVLIDLKFKVPKETYSWSAGVGIPTELSPIYSTDEDVQLFPGCDKNGNAWSLFMQEITSGGAQKIYLQSSGSGLSAATTVQVCGWYKTISV